MMTEERLAEIEEVLSWTEPSLRDTEETTIAELVAEVRRYRTEHDRIRSAVVEMHGQCADDKCWQDASKVYAACGLPDPDRRVGSKAEMLKNCERYVNQQCDEGGPWKSYATLESENARLEAIVHKALKWWNVERGYDVDGSELPAWMTQEARESYEAQQSVGLGTMLAEEWRRMGKPMHPRGAEP